MDCKGMKSFQTGVHPAFTTVRTLPQSSVGYRTAASIDCARRLRVDNQHESGSCQPLVGRCPSLTTICALRNWLVKRCDVYGLNGLRINGESESGFPFLDDVPGFSTVRGPEHARSRSNIKRVLVLRMNR